MGPPSLLGVHAASILLAAKLTLNAIFTLRLFFIKAKILFGFQLAKTGTNVGLL